MSNQDLLNALLAANAAGASTLAAQLEGIRANLETALQNYAAAITATNASLPPGVVPLPSFVPLKNILLQWEQAVTNSIEQQQTSNDAVAKLFTEMVVG